MDGDAIKTQPPGVDRVITRLLTSSIGLKALVAVTGLALVAFVLVHMVGHLQMFDLLGGREGYNGYAHKLQSLGGLKWAARIGLLGAVGMHIWASLTLTMRNKTARGTGPAQNKWVAASLAAQTMRATGPVVLVFIVYHLLHFTVLAVTAAGYADMTAQLADGTVVVDAYGRMIVAFQQPVLTVVYVASVALLGMHLSHGIQSVFQTLGLNNAAYRPAVRKLGPLVAGAIVLGFAVVPLAILGGLVH